MSSGGLWAVACSSIYTHLWDAHSSLLRNYDKYNLLKKVLDLQFSLLIFESSVHSCKYERCKIERLKGNTYKEGGQEVLGGERGVNRPPLAFTCSFSPGSKESAMHLGTREANWPIPTNQPGHLCFWKNKGRWEYLSQEIAFLEFLFFYFFFSENVEKSMKNVGQGREQNTRECMWLRTGVHGRGIKRQGLLCAVKL